MYEQVSHARLNEILASMHSSLRHERMQHFYTRLGANFFSIHTLFRKLYGERADFDIHLQDLVGVMMKQYLNRPTHLKKSDLQREADHTWFLHQKWVAMALYADGYGDDLQGTKARLGYLQDLGINLVHVMPICDCPAEASDGGYAVRDFRKVSERLGSMKDIADLATNMRRREMLLALDVVVNHTSDQHEWALRAQSGEQAFQEYYYVFDDREMPDIYEESMPEIFPESAPGNFTWNEEMGKWVMTVFNHYQWDLNYRNPRVFIEMLDIILYWANAGADILRLDAVAFLWKRLGSSCQNEHEAHLILQLMKDCCQVTAPGVLFIAEAIVAPTEIIKYFGEDAINAKECEIAYNASLMALLWEAAATRKTNLLNIGVRNLPAKLERATWLNYLRCHDDIGWGFADADIVDSGYDPQLHRRFLVDFYTGAYPLSNATGIAFGRNEKNGDARISGALASLAGLEAALERNIQEEIDHAIRTILLLHSMILSFGGIPLLYYGDAIGTLNDDAYLLDESKRSDNRWIHRPKMDWRKAELRNIPGTVEHRIFTGLRHMIAVRKATPAFADFDNRESIELNHPHLFCFLRHAREWSDRKVLVVGNFDHNEHAIDLSPLRKIGTFTYNRLRNLISGEEMQLEGDLLPIAGLGFLWLEC